MAHRSRAHLVMDSAKQDVHRQRKQFERSVERSRALTALAEVRAQAAVAPDGDIPTNSIEAQIGKPFHAGDFIKRLKTLNSSLHFEVAKADSRYMGVYVIDRSRPEGKRHLFGMESGFLPEFSVLHQDDEGHFSRETRGWRTVLARLIKSRLITEAAAIKTFGVPSRASLKWQQAVN
jgi:hypothetical protein